MNLSHPLMALSLAALAGCATVPPGNVIPGENERYEAISTGASEKAALESALKSAETTCSGRGMRHVVLDRHTEYRGLAPEGTVQIIEKATRIFSTSTGRPAPVLADEEDYRVSLQFRCER